MSRFKTAGGKVVGSWGLVAAAVLFPSGCALAETSPYYIGASETFTHESNLFKVSSASNPQSDNIWATSIFAGVDHPFGRQLIRGNLTLTDNRYVDQSQLNFTGYNVLGGLDWATIGRLSGKLTYSRNESQGDYGQLSTPDTGKFVQTTEQIAASVKYELMSSLSLVGGLEHRKINSPDQPQTLSSDVTSDVARLGLTYGLGASVVLGTGVRFTRDKRPQSNGGDDTNNRTDLDLTAVWTPTPLTSVDARVSVGNGDSDSQGGSTSRVTGAIGATYSPTGRLQLRGSFSRETGVDSTFLPAGSTPTGGVTGSYVDNNSVTNWTNLGVTYLLSSKISLNAGYNRSDGSQDQTSGQTSKNIVNRYSLGMQYAVARNFSLGCGYQREERSESTSELNSYTAKTANCTLSYTIQ
jgi:hypothetical protein